MLALRKYKNHDFYVYVGLTLGLQHIVIWEAIAWFQEPPLWSTVTIIEIRHIKIAQNSIGHDLGL